MEFREHVPLAPLTSLQIGGPARWFVEAATDEEVVEAVQFARAKDLPLFVLGGGSNLLIADRGYEGLVLRMASKGIVESRQGDGYRTFSVAAGESWDAFVHYSVNLDCGGVECLAGIPGTVGATPIQNVGAYGQEVSDTIHRVTVLRLSDLSTDSLDARECDFGYRQSIFNRSQAGLHVILNVDFRLREHADACIEYRDLKAFFKSSDSIPTLAQTAAGVREIRNQKGMVLVEGDRDTQSAGSFFKNPVLAKSRLGDIAKAAGLSEDAVPHFSAHANAIKIPAAWLVEQAGFVKGYRKGNAAVSSRHTLALTNRGGATAQEILALRDEIRDRVISRFAVELEMEPMMVGF